jgi:hypothetical protein
MLISIVVATNYSAIKKKLGRGQGREMTQTMYAHVNK